MKQLTGILLVLVASLAAAADDEAHLKAIQAKADEVGQATVKEDWSKLMDLTHPKLIFLAGGREKLIEITKEATNKIKKQGFLVASMQAARPKEIVKTEKDWLAIVPTTMVLTSPKGKVTQKSYLLAVSSAQGIKWVFLDGSGLDQKNVKQFVPSFPENMKLPEKQKPSFEKN